MEEHHSEPNGETPKRKKAASIDKVAYTYFTANHNADTAAILEHCDMNGIYAQEAKEQVLRKVEALMQKFERVQVQDEGEVTLLSIPVQVTTYEDGSNEIKTRYIYTNTRIMYEINQWTKPSNGPAQLQTTETNVLYGSFSIISRTEFEAIEDEKVCKWHIQFKGNDFVGDIDEIVDYLYFHGNVLCKRDDMRQVVSRIISSSEKAIPVVKVYPAVGIYSNKDTQKVTCALDESTVHPTTDSQRSFLKNFSASMKKIDDNDFEMVAKETVNFITAMPAKNAYAALIARGYACLAPLAYVIKETAVNVFPYLYLYGSKGSSKTQIATTAVTFPYGESEVLASDAVESAFRLGTEFTATTMPRVIDEAHDVFLKNISIFKSGATSTLATKRGNKDKTLDRYSAFCSFVFTSNVMPIAVEEDQQGAVMDRVLVVECESGYDFKKEQYQKAMGVLMRKAPVFGKKTVDYLKRLVEVEGGVENLTQDLMRLSDIFMKIDEKVTTRRAYCLAEAALGIKIYDAILREAGVEFPYPILLVDDEAICHMIYEKIQVGIKNEEYMNLNNFMQWAMTVARDERRAAEAGAVLAPIRYEQVDSKSGKLIDSIEHQDILVTTNAFAAFKKSYNLETKPYMTLPELQKALQRLGCESARVGNYRDILQEQRWCVRVSIKEYQEVIEKILDS